MVGRVLVDDRRDGVQGPGQVPFAQPLRLHRIAVRKRKGGLVLGHLLGERRQVRWLLLGGELPNLGHFGGTGVALVGLGRLFELQVQRPVILHPRRLVKRRIELEQLLRRGLRLSYGMPLLQFQRLLGSFHFI